jgi:nucleotide-binding universal stress UspA family protein
MVEAMRQASDGFRRALVVLDPGAAVTWDVPWLRRLVVSGGEIHLLAVLGTARASVLDGRVSLSDRRIADERVTTLAALGTLAGRLRVDGVSGTGHVRFGEPVRTILDTAGDVNADVICLTIAEGQAASGEGTVAGVLRRAHVPVLVGRTLGEGQAGPLETLHSPVIIR